MFRYAFVFLCAVLVLSNVAFIDARKNYGGGGSRHSYPKSPGLSGGGSHGYPSSGGLSGGGSHGGGSHGYPAGGGGSHGYPAGGGSGSHGYPAGGGSGSHGYPANSGNTGAHGYPASSGMSGSNNARYPASPGNNHPSGGTTNIHHHYNYNPPQQISYASPHGAPMHYPVYRGAPPTYVYKYKDSGSKYGTLLAGLALLNLGALGVGAYALSQNHNNRNNNYQTQPGEVCLFGIKKDNGDYEQTRIECQLISSFIYQDMAQRQGQPTNITTVTTTVTNTTIVNSTNPAPETPQAPGAVNMNVGFTMLPNGTLIPGSVTVNDTANMTSGVTPAPAGGASSVSVTTITNTTTVSALDVKGSPVQVTPGMECFVIRKLSNLSTMKKTVPCGLLQTYADKSLQRKPNSAARNVPAFTITAILCAVFVMY